MGRQGGREVPVGGVKWPPMCPPHRGSIFALPLSSWEPAEPLTLGFPM